MSISKTKLFLELLDSTYKKKLTRALINKTEHVYCSSEGDALADAELLNYLYEHSPEAEQSYLPPEDVRESWEEYLPRDDTDDITYEPIVHEGTPGVQFITYFNISMRFL